MTPERVFDFKERSVVAGQAKTSVFYDGGCPLCRAEIAHYQKVDAAGSLSLVDISNDGSELPDGVTRQTLMKRFHVMRDDGTLLSGARAFTHVWRQLPGWAVAGRIASLPGLIQILEGGYRVFLLCRPTIARIYRLFDRSKTSERND